MTDNNNIDDIFRSGLEEFKIEPPESSWNSLASELEKKRADRRRKNGLKLFSLALLLLLISFTTYKIYNLGKTPAPISKEIKSNNNTSAILSNGSAPLASNDNTIVTADRKIETTDKKTADNTDKINNNDNIDNTNNNSKAGNTENKTASAEKSVTVEKNKRTTDIAGKKTISAENSVVVEKNKRTTDAADNNGSKLAVAAVVAQKPSAATVAKENNSSAIKENTVSENVTKSDQSKDNTANSETHHPASDNNHVEIATPVVVEADHQKINTTSNEIQNNAAAPAVTVLATESVNNDIQKEKPSVVESEKQTSTTNYSTSQKSDSSASTAKKILSHLSAEIYYSPDYVNNKLKVNDSYTGTASQDPADYDNQQAAFSYSTGMNLGYDIGSKWTILSGVSYSTFAQTAVYNTINVIADSVYQEVHGHNEPGGGHGGSHGGGHGPGHGGSNPHTPPPGSNDHHYVVQTPCGAIDLYNEPPHHNPGNNQNGDTINIKTETSEEIQFINIPLTVRYKFGHNKLSYFVEGGACMSIVHGDKVKIVVDDAYTENNERDGLKNMNYSLLLGAGVQYNFYKGLNMYLKPSFRYSITPVNQDNPMYSYPYYLGLGIGFSIHF